MKRIGGLVVVVLLLTACASKTAPAGTSVDSTDSHLILYTVESAGGIQSVTYLTGSGQQQDTAVTSGYWSTTVTASAALTPIVTAQNLGAGSITCTITYTDGTPTVTQTSSGQSAVVTCNGGA